MIGIIPAAGKGSRLGMGNKALVKYKGKYLITYSMNKMIEIGIKEFIIIVNGDEIKKKLGDSFKGKPIKYIEQKERKGIAHAISLCEKLVNENMVIIFADIIYEGDLTFMKGLFEQSEAVCFFGGKICHNEEIKKSYGIKGNQIIEKPKDLTGFEPILGLGIYMATPEIFNYIKKTKKGLNGEVQFTDTLNLIEEGKIGMTLLADEYKNINYKEDLE